MYEFLEIVSKRKKELVSLLNILIEKQSKTNNKNIYHYYRYQIEDVENNIALHDTILSYRNISSSYLQ